MGKHDKARAASEATSEPAAPQTMQVRVRAILPPGIGMNAIKNADGKVISDPGRRWYGGDIPGDRLIEREVCLAASVETATPCQCALAHLDATLADSHFEVRDMNGGLLSEPEKEAAEAPRDELGEARKYIGELEHRLRDAETRAAMAHESAKFEYDRALEAEIAKIQAAHRIEIGQLKESIRSPRGQQHWFPGQASLVEKTLQDEDASRNTVR